MVGLRHVAVVFVALALATGGTTAPVEYSLVVEDAETDERYLTTPVANGTTVALEYTHSVEQSRVYDEYEVRGDRLAMTRMEFESYGWGLPADADVTLENGTFVYEPNGTVRELTVAPGRTAGHELHVGDRTYDLVALSEARSVTIRVVHRPALTTVPPVPGAPTPPSYS